MTGILALCSLYAAIVIVRVTDWMAVLLWLLLAVLCAQNLHTHRTPFGAPKLRPTGRMTMLGIGFLLGGFLAYRFLASVWTVAVRVLDLEWSLVSQDVAIQFTFPLAALLLFVLIVPSVEEAIFRGLLLEWLSARTHPSLAVVLAAMIFGLGHFPILGFSHAIQAMLFGIVVGFVRVRTGGLLIGFAVHVLNNAIVYLSSMA